MSTEKTDAIVIRLADFSETSRVVTLFTRDWGKISAMAKGGRRLKGPFESALDLLTVCRIVFLRKSSSSLDLLTEAQLAYRFRPSDKNLVRLYGGYYVAELLAGLTEEYDPHPVLYEEALKTLTRLAEESTLQIDICRFEAVILREIGQWPAMEACSLCDRKVTGAESYVFWLSQDGLICSQCQREGYRQTQIQPGTVAVLRKLASKTDQTVHRIALSPQQFAEARHVLTAAISQALGRRPKMLRYLQF